MFKFAKFAAIHKIAVYVQGHISLQTVDQTTGSLSWVHPRFMLIMYTKFHCNPWTSMAVDCLTNFSCRPTICLVNSIWAELFCPILPIQIFSQISHIGFWNNKKNTVAIKLTLSLTKHVQTVLVWRKRCLWNTIPLPGTSRFKGSRSPEGHC